jgi:AraC-like DNA-binding protein
MSVLICIDEGSEREFLKTIRDGSLHFRRTLDPAVVDDALATGLATHVVIDPQAMPIDILRRISSSAVRMGSHVLIWTSLSGQGVSAVLAANLSPFDDLLLRDYEGDAGLLRSFLCRKPIQRDPVSSRAAVLRRLAPTLRTTSRDLGTDLLRVLLRPRFDRSTTQLLSDLNISRRTFERRLARSRLCGVNALMHLGRLLPAFDLIARDGRAIEDTATAVGYPAGRDLRRHCRTYLDCVPSAFTSHMSVSDFARRVVGVINH